ncbi:T9SS type A sorting domain-containing protein [candidate division KSB1 bacterium]|nr:T9SS type A sorting domain-containing protein [candidate division KSB1 bacterium]
MIWSHYYQPPDHRTYRAKDLEIDHQGNILMTGTLYAFNRPYRVYTTKFNDAGEELWNQTYTPPSSKGGGSPVVAGLVTDSRGYTFVSGHAVPYQNQPEECYCLLYDKSGNLVWIDFIYGMTSAGITLDEQDNVYVAGALRTGKYTSGYATLQYKAETTTAVEKGNIAAVPKHFNLEQNYPNPFNPSTTISFQLPEKENVQLSIYNMAGQLVETLVNEERQPGVHTVQWDANGHSSAVYFCMIKAGSFSKTVKMLLIR